MVTSLQAQKPKIFAQHLVEEEMAKHTDLLIIVFHVTPSGQKENVIVASNIGRIGKEADEDDMRGRTMLEPAVNASPTGLQLRSPAVAFLDRPNFAGAEVVPGRRTIRPTASLNDSEVHRTGLAACTSSVVVTDLAT